MVGFYRGKDLIYAARVRAGLVPATRREVFERIKHLKTAQCPFVNLPELAAGRWGQGLTAEKMKECVWVRPELVARIQFLEWTGADHRCLACYGFSTSCWSTQPPRKKRWRTMSWPTRKMMTIKMTNKRNFTIPSQGEGKVAEAVAFEISVI